MKTMPFSTTSYDKLVFGLRKDVVCLIRLQVSLSCPLVMVIISYKETKSLSNACTTATLTVRKILQLNVSYMN